MTDPLPYDDDAGPWHPAPWGVEALVFGCAGFWVVVGWVVMRWL